MLGSIDIAHNLISKLPKCFT